MHSPLPGRPDARQEITTREREIIAAIREKLARAADDLRGRQVILFGSRATGAARPRSDFDIGVLGPAGLPAAAFFKLEDLLEEIETLYTVELVNLADAPPAFRREALKHFEVLYG